LPHQFCQVARLLPSKAWDDDVMKCLSFIAISLLVWFVYPANGRVDASSVPANQLILVDGSGSMAGFFATGEIQRLNRILANQSGARAELYYYVESNLVNEMPATNFGAVTLLDNALALAIEKRPPILWIVTDNQPSVGGQTASDKDLSAFYEKLGSDVIKRIYLLPLKLRFKGALYTEDD